MFSVQAFKSPGLFGEQGNSVEVPAHMQQEKEKRFLENQFNVVASELVSINRSLPDYRSAEYVLFLSFSECSFQLSESSF